MNRSAKLVLGFALAAGLGHIGTVMATPYLLMKVAMQRLSEDGQRINSFAFGPRTTQASRNVVRPSPDLAYASCVYDLSGGPLQVTAAPSPDQGYLSLSVFAVNSDNIAAFDTGDYPAGISFVLARAGQAVPAGAKVVRSPSNTGIILDRRLAPTAELFTKADAARRVDRCARVEG